MRFDILKGTHVSELLFQTRTDLLTLGGVGGENGNFGKRLEWRNRDETLWME